MKVTEPTPEHLYIQGILAELLDKYEGALVLITRGDGTVSVVSGAVNGDAYRDLIAETPRATEKWAEQALGTQRDVMESEAPKELN